MLFKWCPSICDAGITLNQHSARRLLSPPIAPTSTNSPLSANILLRNVYSVLHEAAHYIQPNMRRRANAVWMLGQRRRRCHNIQTALVRRLVPAYYSIVYHNAVHYCTTDGGPTTTNPLIIIPSHPINICLSNISPSLIEFQERKHWTCYTLVLCEISLCYFFVYLYIYIYPPNQVNRCC